ncbi:MAG: C40 family peptidase [Gammaproteobacteria bacterium]|nr:C40 family peptidase [Gammaproteobacteria bacterium]
MALLALVAGCSTVPAPRPPAAAAPHAPPQPITSRDYLGVLAYAVSLRGAPYRAGGESPDTGFDCSGFVRHVYARLGVDLPRNTAALATALGTVDFAEREAGDLVFFNTTGTPYSHVGIYLGDDRFVHAPSTRTGKVMVSSLMEEYWRRRINGIRRAPPGGPARALRHDDDVARP